MGLIWSFLAAGAEGMCVEAEMLMRLGLRLRYLIDPCQVRTHDNEAATL